MKYFLLLAFVFLTGTNAFAQSDETTDVILSDQAITVENVEEVVSTARLGLGYINDAAWSLDGKTLAVATSIDVSLYPLDGSERQILAEGAVNDVAYSPDGRWLGVAFEDGYAQLFDAATGEAMPEISTFQRVSAITFSPDSKLVAMGLRSTGFANRDAQVVIWDVATGEQVAAQGTTYDPDALQFLPEDSALVIAGFAEVTVWDYQTSYVAQIEGSVVLGWAVSPDGRYVVSTSDDIADIQFFRLYDRETDTFLADITTETREAGANQTLFSPDGSLLLTINPDGVLSARDPLTLRVMSTLAENVAGMAFSPDGETLAVSLFNGIVRLFNVPQRGENGQVSMDVLAIFDGLSRQADMLFFSPDGMYLAAADDTFEMIVWEIGASGEQRRAYWDGFTAPVTALALSPDDSLLASGGSDGFTYVWDQGTESVNAVFTEHAGMVTAVAFSPDGSTIASGDETYTARRTLQVWDAESGAVVVSQFNDGPGAQGPDALVYLPDATLMVAQFFDVASGDDPSELWMTALNGDGLSLTDVLPLHRQDDVTSAKTVDVTPDGRLMAIGYRSGIVRVTDPDSGEAVVMFPNPDSFQAELSAFSGDGRRLAVSYRALDGSGNPLTMIVIWDVETGAEINRFYRELDSVNALAMNPDGSLVALGMVRGTIIVHDAINGESLKTLVGYAEAVSDLIFSHDGDTLIGASEDGTIRLWSLSA